MNISGLHDSPAIRGVQTIGIAVMASQLDLV